MRRTIMLLSICASCATLQVQAQNQILAKTTGPITQRLDVSFQKTSSLIFPAAIKSVDRGTEDILVQKPEGVENVLKVKAGRQFFPETNLSVITADGRFYSFTVDYNANPTNLVFQLVQTGSIPAAQKAQAIFSDATNEQLIAALAAKASVSKRNIKRVSDKSYGIKASVKGLYTANDLFFYKILVNNKSNIDYNGASLRFFIDDKKKVKRTASQQIAIEPVAVTGDYHNIKAGSHEMLIAVLPKQMIGRDKRLHIDLDEQNGGRNLICTMSNKELLKAERVTPLNDPNGPALSAILTK